jgi:hypothetical protein
LPASGPRRDPAKLRRRIELLRRALYDAYQRGEPLTGDRILSLSAEIDLLLNEYLRDAATGAV